MQMTNYDTIAQPWAETPNRVKLPTLANAPWFYAHHPLQWDVVEFKKIEHVTKNKKITQVETTTFLLLPKVDKIPMVPGVNNVRDGGDLTLMRGQMHKEGWVILEPQDHNYINVYPCRNGKYFAPRFTKMETLANQLIQTFDHEEFNAWRKTLIASHKIALPHEHVCRLMQIELEQKINNLKDTHLPHMQVKQQKISNSIANLIEAIENAKQVQNYV
jgi:hypothetical protein